MNEFQTSDIAEHALAEVLKISPNSDERAYTALINDAMASAPIWDADRKSIVQKLEDRNILPEIVVGYLKNNFSKLDQNNDGQLTVEELAGPKKPIYEPNWRDPVRAVSNESIKSDFDKELLDELKTSPGLYRSIADASKVGDSPFNIEIVDLEIYSANRSKQTAFRQSTQPLLKGGMDSWMAQLDEKDGKYDGYASAEDIANFKKKQATHSTPGFKPTVPMLFGDLVGAGKEVNFAQEIADGKHPELLRDGVLDLVSIMRKAGLKPKVVNSEVDYLDVEDRLKRTQLGYSGRGRRLVINQPAPDTK